MSTIKVASTDYVDEKVSSIVEFTGASNNTDGASGLVTFPSAGDQEKFLKGDGTWSIPTDTTYDEASITSAGLLSAEDKAKLDGIQEESNKTIIDSELSDTSTNPVQNKVINNALNNKSDTDHSHSKSDITDFPTSLPASDVSAWAKADTKPSYTADEVGADPSGSANTALASAKSYTDTKIADLINGAPETLDTLGEIATAISENESVVEAITDAIGSKASSSDFNAHISNESNPHNVTKSQIGLGEVPNVSTNDQTPTFTESSSLSSLLSGEKLSIALGKISKAITDLISHIGDSIKHISNEERTNWNSAKIHADSTHAPIDAQANVIENIKVNGTTIEPNSKSVDISIPSAGNGTITITQNGNTKGTFTTNQNTDATIEIPNTTYENASATNDGLLSATDKAKLDSIQVGSNKTVVDSELSDTSTNPIQNRVVNDALNNKSDVDHKHTKSDITDFPTSLPASDVSDWAKADTKPSYTADEVGADPSGSANTALASAKYYTDTAITNKADKSELSDYATVTALSNGLTGKQDLLVSTESLAGVDWNTLTYTKIYRIHNISLADEYTHGLDGVYNYGMLYISVVNSTPYQYYITDIGRFNNDGGIYFRCKYSDTNNGWRDWRRLDTCVKGEAETKYRSGLVNITKENLGIGKSTVTLTTSNWSNNTQTVNISIVNESCTVIVAPDPDSQENYTKSGVKCVSQSIGNLTFTCDKLPETNITVNIVIL